MGTFSTSTGERFTTEQIDRKIRIAKEGKINMMSVSNGYVFCEECGRSRGMPIDCAHVISVKEAKETGRAELSWDIDNIKMKCRGCHQKQDGLNLKFTEDETK